METEFRKEIQKDYEEKNNAFNVHNHLKSKTLEELKEISKKDTSNFEIMLLNITGDLNFGMIIRTGHLLGAKRVIILGRRRIDKRATVGAENYTKVERYDALRDDLTIDEEVFMKIMNKKKSYFPIFVELGGKSLKTIDWKLEIPKKSTPIFIFGNENRGIGENIIATMKKMNKGIIVSIPQKGVLRSFNVAAAASMMLWDFVKSTDLI